MGVYNTHVKVKSTNLTTLLFGGHHTPIHEELEHDDSVEREDCCDVEEDERVVHFLDNSEQASQAS